MGTTTTSPRVDPVLRDTVTVRSATEVARRHRLRPDDVRAHWSRSNSFCVTRARRYIRHIVEQATRGPLPSDLVEIAEEIRLGDQLTLRDLLEDPAHEATLAQLARRNQPSARRTGAVMRPGNSG